jgi:glutathione synthase
MTLDIAIVMDPIGSIKTAKDSTFAMMLEAQRRGHRVFYVQPGGLGIAGGEAVARVMPVTVRDQAYDFHALGEASTRPLAAFGAVLMRKDPPVDAAFMHDTQVLSLGQAQGARVVNDPQGLRDLNEKLAALLFPDLCPPTLVSRDHDALRAFISEHGDTVLKPLDGMGGRSIFRVRDGESNTNVILETLTGGGVHLAMAQRYLPEIVDGDKRLLLIGGKVAPFVLARIPQGSEVRGNLAAGGKGVAQPLTDDNRAVAEAMAPVLAARGLLLVGLDMIGNRVTEINVTSPTCFQEIQQQAGFDVPAMFVDALEAALR